jgi:hypothetical protein
LNGYGVCIYSDGSKYEGNWKKGAFDGSGKYYYPNGNIYYDGEWLEK